MGDLLGFVLSGLVSGALYALLATGLVLSYSASGLFNFAHGATAYLCALAFYELHSGFGWPAVPTAVLLVCVVAPALGWGLDRLMFRKLARVGETAQIVATIGLLVALPAAGLWVVELLERAGAPVQPAENQFGLPGVGPSPAVSWQPLDGVGIDSDQLITWVATALVAAGLWVLMRHTRLGLRLRAAVDNRSLTELRGISADRLSSIAWMLSSGLAGLAGVLATPLLGLSAHDYTLFLFVSATAAVLGRFLSVPLAFAGGLGLGVLQNLVAGYASFAEDITGFRTAVPFLILFGGLVVLAQRRRAAGTAAADPPPVDYLAGKGRRRRWGAWVVAGVLLATAFYTVTTPFWSGILAQGLAIGLVFMSFTVVTGLGAMVSLAQATFVTGAALVGAAGGRWGLSLRRPLRSRQRSGCGACVLGRGCRRCHRSWRVQTSDDRPGWGVASLAGAAGGCGGRAWWGVACPRFCWCRQVGFAACGRCRGCRGRFQGAEHLRGGDRAVAAVRGAAVAGATGRPRCREPAGPAPGGAE